MVLIVFVSICTHRLSSRSATPGTLVDSSFAPTETSPPVCPLFKKAVESPDVSHTFVHDTSVKVPTASLPVSPDPKALLEIPTVDLSVGLLGTTASPLGAVSREKVYADACVEAQPPCEAPTSSLPSPAPPTSHSRRPSARLLGTSFPSPPPAHLNGTMHRPPKPAAYLQGRRSPWTTAALPA